MSSVKRHNHRVHPCTAKQKNALLNVLIAKDDIPSILIVTANDTEHIDITGHHENATVMSDADLAASTEITCNLLISYDLPRDPAAYMLRLERAQHAALILLDEDERALLYPIESLLGRTLIQEQLHGFEATFAMKPEVTERTYKKEAPRDVKGPKKSSHKKFNAKGRSSKGTTRKISSKVFKAAKEGK